jgi:hypothetical protein
MTWPPQSPDLNPIEMVWDELDRKCRKISQQVLSICGNFFKTVGKAFLMKLVERMQRVCKAVIKAKGGYFEESKIYFDFFEHLFAYYMIPCVLFHSFDVFTIIQQCNVNVNVENSQNKEKL